MDFDFAPGALPGSLELAYLGDSLYDLYVRAALVRAGGHVRDMHRAAVRRVCAHAQAEAFVRIENGEVIVYGMHVSPYEKGNIFNKDPLRPKKLLMHKSEIRKLTEKLAEQGYTLVPVEVYLKGSLVKVEIALAKGKKLYDKRQDIAKKDMRREAERDFKVKNLY